VCSSDLFLSIQDFADFCRNKGLRVLDAVFLGTDRVVNRWPNLRARNAIYVLTTP